MVRVQGRGQKENKVKDERGTRQGNSTSGSGRGGNREVVRKEISVRIIVACGHDKFVMVAQCWHWWCFSCLSDNGAMGVGVCVVVGVVVVDAGCRLL